MVQITPEESDCAIVTWGLGSCFSVQVTNTILAFDVGLSLELNGVCVLFHSDRNSPCCKNCQFETAQKKCQEAINATCKGVSYCTGNSSECPPPGDAEDDTVCLDLGKCKAGKCIPFCKREQELESCACAGE